MAGPALVLAFDPFAWLAGVSDAAIVVACAVAACLGAFPVARWLGLVEWLSPRRSKRLESLSALADDVVRTACAPKGEAGTTGGVYAPLVHAATHALSRGLPPAETRAAAETAVRGWADRRARARALALPLCRFGPAVALGSALAMLVLMAEYWADPAAISSVVAAWIGGLMVVSLLGTTILSAAGDQLELSEVSDELAATVVVEAVRRLAAGQPAQEVRYRLEALLRPRSTVGAASDLRKAA